MSVLDIDLKLCQEEKLRNGSYKIVFPHPRSFTRRARALSKSESFLFHEIPVVLYAS